MVDANASPGAADGKAVHCAGLHSSSSTPLMRSYVEEHRLVLPNTTAVHSGDLSTWIDPAGHRAYCIDYVMLSEDLAQACTLSRVVPDLDLGHGSWDHSATAVDLQWDAGIQKAVHTEKRKKGFDPTLIGRSTLERILQDYKPEAWHVDIESQVQALNEAILTGLRQQCPPAKNRPKKAFITDQIWQLRQNKLDLRSRLKALSRRQRDERLLCFFGAWASTCDARDAPDRNTFQQYNVFLQCASVQLVARYHRATSDLRHHLKQAKQRLIKDKIETMHPDASAACILHELKPILGPTNLKKLKVATLPYVCNAEGDHCQLPNEAIETWADFFRHMEGGVRLDLEAQRGIWLDNLERFQQEGFNIDGEELPSLVELEAAYRRVNPAKATGPDDIHPMVCRAAPHVLARMTYGQLLKLTTHGQEALTHKGGVLHPIWKMKGPRDQCSSYRSILISSHIGKCIHRSIRQHQTSLFAKFLQKEQVGGRPKVPVTLGVHTARAFLRSRQALGHNVGMLYLDLTEAFYRILRPLVVGGPVEDDLILHVGAHLGLSEDLLKELHQYLDEPAAIERAGLPGHMRNTLRALHEDTHFQVRGQRDICRTSLGSRPGDCFADVIFSYLWGRILHRLQDQLCQLGLGEHIPMENGLRLQRLDPQQGLPEQQFLGPTWMDDSFICLSEADPQRLERKLCQGTGLLLALCEGHGLTPNIQAGKTEALLAFQGRGSRQMRIRYFGPSSEKVITLVGEMGIKKVRVVNNYTHLGCVIHHKSDNRKEARRRIALAQQAFNQHRRHLLQNPIITKQRRGELFGTLVMSKFCYGTESWTFTDNRSKLQVHNALMRLFRRLLRRGHEEHLQDEDILVATEMNSPTEILRLARLRYIGTLYKCKELVPWGLLNCDAAWTDLVADDLQWVWHQLRDSSRLPNPTEHLPFWQDIWEHHPSYWKRLVKRAGLHAKQQRANHHRVLTFRKRFATLFGQVPGGGDIFVPGLDIEMKPEEESDEPYACMRCQMMFRSKGGLGAHLFRAHHIVAKVRLLFDSTCCNACLVEYHTLSKLKAHLQRSQACSAQLWGRRSYTRPVGGCGSSQDQALCQRHDGVLPPLQAEGPRLRPAQGETIPEHDLELAERIYMKILERASLDDIVQIVKETILDFPISWHGCRATLDYLIEEMTATDIEALAIGDFDIKHFLRALRHRDAWSFLNEEHATFRQERRALTLADIEEQCRDGLDKMACRDPLWPVPRPMLRERYVIHAFSGRRRPGDFQYFLDQAQANHAETIIHTISVDLMVDPIWGDVSRDEVRSFWLAAVRDRMVVGAMAGPPCETWSQARGRPAHNTAEKTAFRMPRVVRDGDAPWGKASLALRELLQLDVGNLLLLFTLELLINLALEGGVGGLEHPAPPEDTTKASIWRLPVMKLLLSWPEFSFLELSQGLWGAPSRKPTGLLLLNMPEMIGALRSWQISRDLPRAAAIGLTGDGIWATSYLKEYPPALCAGLAEGFFRCLQQHAVDTSIVVKSDFVRLADSMNVKDYGQSAGPDFAK